ncbi:MAG: hypothetical protein ACFFD4_09045 [Candidatus Odinarchaeota archaeon]
MMMNKVRLILGIFILLFMASSPFVQVALSPALELNGSDTGSIKNDYSQSDLLQKLQSQEFPPSEVDPYLQHENATYPEDFDVGSFLSDNENDYNEKWDPWLTKAAIHDIVSKDDGDMIALAGGYLYDNEVHVYRWNYLEDKYDKVWDVGDGVFMSDVTSLAFSDVDYNNLTELIAGSADGHLYVFEQRHIYDPITNMENQFDLVWKSPRLGRVWAVLSADTDLDYRPDIIVGTGNTVRFYEYYHHSGYPFSTEHWIEFEEVFSYTVDSQITALTTSDIDYDGLPEVVIGTYSGEIILLENEGTSLIINGYPYPIANDNHYYNMWSSGELIRRRISSMSGGNLDSDGVKEILIAAQGQGAYILDSIGTSPQLFRLNRDYETWEDDDAESYPLDYYIDYMINSSSYLYNNVLYNNGTGPYIYPEPLNQTFGSVFLEVYPYNTAMAQNETGGTMNQAWNQFTLLNGTENEAWAIVDFNYDEEASGNGMYGVPVSSKAYDLIINIGPGVPPSINNFSLEFSVDGESFYQVPDGDIFVINNFFGDDYLYVEVDPTLINMRSDYYRYVRVNTTAEMYIDYMQTRYINKPVHDALSVEVGSTVFKGDTAPTSVGFIGTVGGSILGVTWDETEKRYKIAWDSWVEERWKLDTNIFDLAIIKQTGRFPAWLDRGSLDYLISGAGGVPMTIETVDYAMDNFYNFENENNLEFVLTDRTGLIYLLTQVSPTATPEDNPALASYLFSEVQTYIGSHPHDYWSVSIVPMIREGLPPEESNYWLFLGHWDGTLGQFSPGSVINPGDIDVKAYFMSSGDSSGKFLPVELLNNEDHTLSYSELTGQMWGIFRESTWMPKVAGGDFIGSSTTDLVVTNGKIHLLETTIGMNEKLQTVLVDNYFKEINDNSKGRQWSNPNVVDFDGDGDLDLILGFATHNKSFHDTNMNVTKGYGMTYWENQGSRDRPKWVEIKKVVTNNDPDSNLRVNLYRAPVIVGDEYDWGDDYLNYNKYYPAYKTGKATRLFMFQPTLGEDPNTGWNFVYDYYRGIIKQFSAFYDHPTSLLAATYPEAKRLDINLMYDFGIFDYINYGFHITESWSNVEELKQWTLAMTASDLDEDGMNEIIVGDFDNNVYVFEHMTNNTYKRAFRSFDINRTELSALSPYAWEQFEGISGEFIRTVFEHVKHLVAGSDLDQDGLQEFLAATDDMVFVFEATYSPTGRINDDTYVLVDTINIQETPQLEGIPAEERVINAITTADDLTADGRLEIVIAVTSALLIYEITPETPGGATVDGYSASFGWDKHEIFTDYFYPSAYLDDPMYGYVIEDFQGKYGVPGNHFKFPDHYISDVIVTDLDRDGRLELVYGGWSGNYAARPLRDGFVNILEWNDGDFFYYSGEAFRAITEYQLSTIDFTEMYTFETADQDYDGLPELIIGHEHGISIYECTGHFEFAKQETITSNPNYPVLIPKYDAPYPSSEFGVARLAANVPYGEYYQYSFGEDKALVELETGILVLFYPLGPYYYYAVSVDEGKNWIPGPSLGDFGFGAAYQSASEIDALVTKEQGVEYIWVVVTVQHNSGGPKTAVALQILDTSQGWLSPYSFTVANSYLNGGSVSPALYEVPYGTITEPCIGMAYIDHPYNSIIFGHWHSSAAGGGAIYIPNAVHDYANNSLGISGHVNATGLDIVDLVTGDGDDYGIIISGFLQSEVLSLDHDLFFGQFKHSADPVYNFTRFTRVTTSGMSSYNPTMIREEHTDNLLVTYEEMTLTPYGGLWAVWSNDNGLTWSKPFAMNYPVGIYDPTGLLFSPVSTSTGSFYLESPIMFGGVVSYYSAFGPALAARRGSGFHMVYSLDFDVEFTYKGERTNVLGASYITTVTNPHSNFTWYDIGEVKDIAVGDSDTDVRQEIFAATGDRATLFEFAENSKTHILHEQEWISPEYEYGVSSVLIADGNGNGYPELLIESERGTVHSYEVINRGGIADIVFPVMEENITLTASSGNLVTRIRTLDVTGDGIEDFIYSTLDQRLIGINGSDMSVFMDTGDQIAIDLTYRIDPDFEVIHNGSGHAVAIAMFNGENLTIWRLNSGEFTGNFDFTGNRIRSLSVAEITGDGTEEIIIGTDNGSLYVIELDAQLEPTILWQKSDTAHEIFFVSGARISSNSSYDVIAIDSDGNVTAYYPNGTLNWHNISSYTHWGGAVFDINDDGIDDVVAGTNRTFAFDGMDGSKLWNTTVPTWLGSRTTLKDINNDEVPDIIFGTAMNPVSGWPGYSVGAISGSSGEMLWTYDSNQYGIPGWLFPNFMTAEGSLNLSTMVETVVVPTIELYGGPDQQLVYLMDPYGGVTQGAILLGMDSIAVEVATLGFDRPVILVGAEDGTVRIYSVYKDRPEPSKPASTRVEFTTKLSVTGLYHDDMLAADIADSTGKIGVTDGIDEIIVIQDEEIIAKNITNHYVDLDPNSDEYKIDTRDYGLYQGPAMFADFDTTGAVYRPFLVVAYNESMILVNLLDLSVLNVKWSAQFGFGNYTNGNFEIVEVTGDDVLDIVFSREYFNVMTTWYGQIGIFDGKDLIDVGDTIAFFTDQYIQKADVKFVTGDFDGDTNSDVLVIFQNRTNLIGQYLFAIYKGTGGLSYSENRLLFPVRFVSAGNFDADSSDEFIVYVDFAFLETIFGFDLKGLFPDIAIPLEYNGATFVAAGSPFVAHVVGKTVEVTVNDWSGDGFDDMLVRTDRNRYYVIDGGTMKISANIPLAAMADSDTSTALGNFGKSEKDTDLAIIAHDKVLVMSDVTTEPRVLWYSQLEDDMVLDMVKGDFDGDDIDDIAAMSYFGIVYVYSSESDFPDIPKIVAGPENIRSTAYSSVLAVILIIGMPVMAASIVIALNKKKWPGK